MGRTKRQPEQESPDTSEAKAPASRPLRLEYRSPQELAENPRNWRRHPEEQIAALTDVIAEVGWGGACLLNERTGRLIDGHARQKVAIAQGAAVVPVLIGSWSEAEEAKILATLDPLAAMAVADESMLASLVLDIETESAAIASLLESLLAEEEEQISPDGGGDAFDATPEEGETRAQAGDLWLLDGRHRLLIADCTKAENVTRLYGGKVPFMMVTDPPYGVDYDPTWRHRAGINKSNRTGKVANDHIADWAATWRLFPGQVAYVWHGGLHAATVQKSLEDAGLFAKAQIVWVKPRLVLSRGHYHWKHEPCYQAERPDVTEPSTDDGCEEAWYVTRKGSVAAYRGGRKQTTVWNIGFQGEEKTHHGTQKPLECMARPIRNHGAKGDIVYDPFLGSGTTLIAAHRTGRVCYGCEIDPRYGDVILKRSEAEGMTIEKLSE